ncbi:DUF6318 family protein [Arsenicicoccus sp. oral taxon 190]|uniref:DUF6318 family protein n=1 Tax=Arsenicicoccus sp. oral taxon 190 TaxID=1658671 RepID=UPI00067CB719|nr:DUF6318 family protein [Arsenicicoccus sp. oral taxon 190]
MPPTTAGKPVSASASASPSGSASTTPTASATISGAAGSSSPAGGPAAIPAAARAHTPEGAEAFTRYWVTTVNSSWRSANGAAIRALSAGDCAGCTSLAKDADRFMIEHRRVESDPLSLISIKPLGTDELDRTRILLVTEQLPVKIMNADGSTYQTLPRTINKSDLALQYTGSGWRVAEVGSPG